MIFNGNMRHFLQQTFLIVSIYECICDLKWDASTRITFSNQCKSFFCDLMLNFHITGMYVWCYVWINKVHFTLLICCVDCVNKMVICNIVGTIIILIIFLAPPAEWQRSFSNTDSSVVNFSLKCLISQNWPDNFFSFLAWSFLGKVLMYCKNYGFGWIILKVNLKGQIWRQFSQKNCLITFSLFCHEASQGGCWWTAKRSIWLNHSKGHFSRFERLKKGQIWLFGQFSQKWFDNLYTASWGWYWSTVKRWISLNYSKGHFQGRKGQVKPIFPSLLILFSSNEVLPKFIASCSFFVVKPILSYNMKGMESL